ncbi:MAG: polyprenyl synthetase family protein [Anaerolineales bacterium]|jgi:geranylgeranyl diphosphate synthase type I
MPDSELKPIEVMLPAVEADLQDSLNLARQWLPAVVEEMITYHLGWSGPEEISGKRIRPLLVLLCCQASGGEWRAALPAASAIEWIHNFSLIHDDIQDNSQTRRGRPTVWKKWGNAQAINTGDALFALARLTTQRLMGNGFPAEKVLTVHRILDETSLALTRGQHFDIAFESMDRVTPDTYLDMIAGKTAALLGASCQIGALLSPANEDQITAYRTFGENLGLAFQVIDDLLGIWGVETTTGKSSADDLQTGKKTLPVIHGLEHSAEFRRQWADGERQEGSLAALKQLLEEAGSRDFSAEWAHQYSEEALAALEAAQPHEPAKNELSTLTARLLQRIA